MMANSSTREGDQPDDHHVGQARAADGQQPVADGWTQDLRGMKGRRPPGGRVLVVLARHQLGTERGVGGAEEGAAEAGQGLRRRTATAGRRAQAEQQQ
jgi:hypothetical protein